MEVAAEEEDEDELLLLLLLLLLDAGFGLELDENGGAPSVSVLIH